VHRSAVAIPLTLAAIALAGCAPDAVKPSSPFDAFLAQIRNDCYTQRIGGVNVGALLEPTGSNQAVYFVDQTSRLYFGKISREAWTTGVTGFLVGRATDPGVKCVLDRLPAKPPAAP
jgi:hypothetical protein